MHIHQVGPASAASPAHTTLALQWSSGTSALLAALVELLLLVLLLLRVLVRRQGGWRRAWHALGRQIRLTWRAFADPVREFLRFKASVRQLTRLLSSTDTRAIAVEALDDADDVLAPAAEGAYGYAARVEHARRPSAEVAVHLAGRLVPLPGAPWQRQDGDERLWWAPAAELLAAAGRERALPPGPGDLAVEGADDADAADDLARARLLVPVGLDGDAVVMLDLLRGPGLLSTHGSAATGRAFVQALAAYLDMAGGDAEVLVAAGVHPRHHGPDLDELLAELERRVVEPAVPVVVVCAAPDEQQAERLTALARGGQLCALVAGPVAGHRWEVHVDARGRVRAPGFAFTADAAPLGPAVARTARKGPRGGGGPAPRPRVSVPQARTEAPAAPAPSPVPPPRQAVLPPGTVTVPPAESSPEPPAAAVRDLFAEPEITGVSAADGRHAASYATPHEENRNES